MLMVRGSYDTLLGNSSGLLKLPYVAMGEPAAYT
jgi:hypothetical protein